MKRLAMFLDGTWNVISDNTNVWRFRALLAPTSVDGQKQCAYYSTGLGTKFGERLRGGMFGWGIDTAITSAYEWLMDNYEDDDEIFIFGFSRGAYMARSLSGFVSECGLLEPGAPLGVNQMYCRYRIPDATTLRELQRQQREEGRTNFTREERSMLQFSRAIPIKFLGIFDTVGSLGVPFPLYRRIVGRAYPFLNTGLRQSNEFAFHALALDEHRKAFDATLWTNKGATNAKPRPIERTEQRWFVGSHANVGGGYYDDPLAQLPFKWIEARAMGLGLTFIRQYPIAADVASCKIPNSFAEFLKGWYRVLKFWIPHHRKIDTPPKDEGPGVSNINETIDASVFERWRQNASYRPQSLRRWAKKHSIDPTRITTSVRTDNPSVSVPD